MLPLKKDDFGATRHVELGLPRTNVIAHENLSARFDRYKLTSGYNAYINARQFQGSANSMHGDGSPPEFRYPDSTYTSTMSLTVGVTTRNHRLICIFLWDPGLDSPGMSPTEWASILGRPDCCRVFRKSISS